MGLALSPYSVRLALLFGTFATAFSAFAFLVAGGGILSFLSARARFPVDVTLAIAAVGLRLYASHR